jgi:hypothetical protein
VSKPRKREFERLLAPRQAGYASLWAVADSYDITGGVIQPASTNEPRFYSPLANADLFRSFAYLGARGAPSERSVLGWVSKHGLLTRKDSKNLYPWLEADGKLVTNQASMDLDDFGREVEGAYQLLSIVVNIREAKTEAVRAAFDRALKGTGAYITTLDENLMAMDRIRQAIASTPQQGASWVSDPDHLTIFLATRALMGTVQTKISGVQLGFGDQALAGADLKGSDLIPTKGWTCPDLLSAIYLQLYLWLTDNRALRRCRFCGRPFPVTRSDKVYCSKNHVVQARHYLKKGETFPADR